MAGNIPPLVSTTPPPLCAFDEDEEEEEDEFGIYNTAEELDFTECISFKENDEEKQNIANSRGEQDSTSQDSVTDSGLCPDSEGVSPTPHSDDERSIKQNSCDKQCQQISNLFVSPIQETSNCESDISECLENSLTVETVNGPNLPSGHVESEDHFVQAGSDDDFGSFENASSFCVQFYEKKDDCGTGLTTDLPEPVTNQSQIKECDNHISTTLENRECGQNYMNCTGIPCQKLILGTSNGLSSDESINLSLKMETIISSNGNKHEQHNLMNEKGVVKIEVGNSLENKQQEKVNLNYTRTENSYNNEEYDDFTDFKTDFSNFESFKIEQFQEIIQNVEVLSEKTTLENVPTSSSLFNEDERDEEISNFTNFSYSDCAFVSAQSSGSVQNVSQILPKLDSDWRTESEIQDWVSVFPCDVNESSVISGPILPREDDIVWSRLFPLESTPALSYQWNESLVNRKLLSALNIDSRNILFMPWSNSAFPRFAANLSCGPLEPVKAPEPLQPTLLPQPSSQPTPPPQESVPDAHFDWVSSGLTNPLDCPKTVLKLPKTLSAEAESILNSLPDISYMRKTYIDFPISEV